MPVRYLTRGMIDGSLSTLGVVIGAAISADPKVIIAAGLGGGIANSISNVLGALTAEKASIMQKYAKYEKSLVGSDVKLKNTKIYEKEKRKILESGLLDGFATLVGALVPVVPFFFLMDVGTAVQASVGMTLALLFVLGVYLGKLSKENLVWAGTKMAIFGGVTAIIANSLEMFFG